MKIFLNKIQNHIQKIPMPFLLVGGCILAYGLLAPWLGFYLDDWYIVLYQKYFGATDFSLFFAQDRPFFGYVYQVFVPIFKDSRIGWQLFAVFSHALAASSFWWLLIKLLPNRKKLSTVASLLFAVYPGFQMHWFAVMYSQVFFLMAVYFLSFILMIDAVRREKGKVFFTLGALICLIIGIVPQETFFGIEFIRPVILWVVVTQQERDAKKRLKRTLFNWIPYLLVTLMFAIYRLGNSQTYNYQPGLLKELAQKPLDTIINLVGEVFWASLDALFRTWLNLINLLKRDLLSSVSLAMIVLILIGIGSTWLIINGKKETEKAGKENIFILLSSLLVTITAMSPFIIGSFKISLDFPNNRYLLALAPGASLFLAVFIDSFLGTDKQKVITYAILIGFAIGSQFITARSFLLNWNAQKDFFWQLTWRAPNIEPDTVLITEDVPFSKYYSGTSLTAPLNIIYGAENNSHNIPYLMVLEDQQYDLINSFEENIPISYDFRSFVFSGNTSSVVVFKKPADGCLRILTPADKPEEFDKNDQRGFWTSALPVSNINRIISDPEEQVIPPEKYFGIENQDQWCYYYEKADLARQKKQWMEVIQRYQDAEAAGYHPQIDSEWIPLVDAYIQAGLVEEALQVTKNVTNHDQINTAGFCQLWTNAMSDKNVLPFAEEILSWLNCSVSYEE